MNTYYSEINSIKNTFYLEQEEADKILSLLDDYELDYEEEETEEEEDDFFSVT